MRRLARDLLNLLGMVLITFGFSVFLWIRFLDSSEKPSTIYALGHWWDLDWEVVLPAAVAGVTLFIMTSLRFGRPTTPGYCRQCGYDLRASPDRCPECGTTPAVSAAAQS